MAPGGLAEAPAALPASPTHVATSATPDDGERRQLTAVFVDLVGSTALSRQLDPEDYRAALERYRAAVDARVRRHGGHVTRLLGDGIFASFGFPRTHEDDAVAAVRAGLDAVTAIAELAPTAAGPLAARVGIATGMVVVADASTEAGHVVFGETPNLAARLQQAAAVGRVMVCATTRRLVEGHFTCGEPVLLELKGFGAPVPAFEVRGRLDGRHRWEMSDGAVPRAMLGRRDEIDLLVRRWRDAAGGQGRVVLVSGEPGIGKSRTTVALRDAIQSESLLHVHLFGSAHHQNSALFPFIEHLQRAARMLHGDAAAVRRTKLAAALGTADEAGDDFALLADLLSLSVAADRPRLALPPQARKEQTFRALTRQFERLTATAPVLVVVEDAHWFDPTSLELLTQTVERAERLPVLIVVTARPEFTPPWPAAAHVSTIALTRLGRDDGVALIRGIAGGRTLPPQVVEQILERTDGVPLFIEELTKTVIESGVTAATPDVGAIPATLHASLFARLDRLGPVREVAQIGAALGRSFSYVLLEAIAGLPEDRLRSGLDQLVGAGLLFRRGELPGAVFTFKHALVRDAAYASLLKTRRARLHATIAAVLRKDFPELVRLEPETLAHHLTEAGAIREAVGEWLHAGQQAAERSANLEAIAHYRRGLSLVEQLPQGAKRDRLELDLHFALGPSLIATQGPASGVALATFDAARALCERLGDPPETLQVMFWLATASVIRGELARADEAVVTLLRLADAGLDDRPALLNALRGRSMILLFMGRLGEARATLERFEATFDASTPEAQLAARAAGQDARAAGLALASWAAWLAGDAEGAAAARAASLARADEVGDAHSRAYVTYYAAVLYGLQGDVCSATEAAARCLALAEAHGFAQWQGLARAVIGIGALASNRNEAGQAMGDVTEALASYRRAGYQLGMTALYVMVLPVLVASGRLDVARDLVEDGLAIAAGNGERIFEAELHRLAAQVAVAGGAALGDRAADRHLEQALAIARKQGALELERRARRDRDAAVEPGVRSTFPAPAQ